jgi:ABC-type transport system involved in cytochrome c biogenesis permease component
MRWLLAKDLQILRRSPLLVALLVFYPIVVALMIGFALSSPPGKPKVAVLNELTPGQGTISLGGQDVDVTKYSGRLFRSIDPVRVTSRAQAVEKVRSGEALAALVIPSDIARKLATGISPPTIEVILNVDDPLEQELVDQVLKARLSDANTALSKKYTQIAAADIKLLSSGGRFSLLGQHLDILGLRRASTTLKATRDALPRGSPARKPLDRVIEFARLAIDNLGLADDVLRSIGTPVRVERTELSGKTTPTDAYAVVIAVTVSLMFVALLLAAGMLALEREEHAFGRLVRGLVSRSALLAEKALLAGACAAGTALLMAVGVGLFSAPHWSRLPLWALALLVAGLAFGALGVALGALAREVRAASLLAFGLALPVAFIALVPGSAVSGGLHDVLDAISAIFPFKPALQAIDAAINGSTDPGLGGPLLHLVALAAAWGAAARLAVRRF